MATCDSCGNEYDKTFTITRGQIVGTSDSFECAITMMAPVCLNCDCRILGHGVETDEAVYCCAHCARVAGNENTELVDRT